MKQSGLTDFKTHAVVPSFEPWTVANFMPVCIEYLFLISLLIPRKPKVFHIHLAYDSRAFLVNPNVAKNTHAVNGSTQKSHSFVSADVEFDLHSLDGIVGICEKLACSTVKP